MMTGHGSFSPGRRFRRPRDVAENLHLSRHEKLQILHRWEHDSRSLAATDGAEMGRVEADKLGEIRAAIRAVIGAGPSDTSEGQSAPTKYDLRASEATLRVLEIMKHDPTMIHAESTLHEAAAQMRDRNTGLLFVVEGNDVIGCVTDRDLVVRGLGTPGPTQDKRVADIMTRYVISCREDETADDLARIMCRERITRAAVIDDRRQLKGVASIGDLAVAPVDTTLIADVVVGVMQDVSGLPYRGRESERPVRVRAPKPASA